MSEWVVRGEYTGVLRRYGLKIAICGKIKVHLMGRPARQSSFVYLNWCKQPMIPGHSGEPVWEDFLILQGWFLPRYACK